MKVQAKLKMGYKRGVKYAVEQVMYLPDNYQNDFFRKPTFKEDDVYPYTNEVNDLSDFFVCTKSISVSTKVYHN